MIIILGGYRPRGARAVIVHGRRRREARARARVLGPLVGPRNCDVESLIFTALGDGNGWDALKCSISVVREMSGCYSARGPYTQNRFK